MDVEPSFQTVESEAVRYQGRRTGLRIHLCHTTRVFLDDVQRAILRRREPSGPAKPLTTERGVARVSPSSRI